MSSHSFPRRSGTKRRGTKRKAGGGRRPIPPRRVFEGIIYVLRTGCQWKALPKDECGAPLSLVVTGADRHDVSQLGAVLDNRIILLRNGQSKISVQTKYISGEPAKKIIDAHAYIPYVKERGEEMTNMKNAHGYHASSVGRRTNPFVAQPISQASGTL